MIGVHINESQEKWYFSIVDAVAILTDSVDPTIPLDSVNPIA